MTKSFYITTTLPYVNADPHIGFAAEIVHADKPNCIFLILFFASLFFHSIIAWLVTLVFGASTYLHFELK